MDLHSIDNHDHASTSFKVVLLVFAIVLIGALGYLVNQQNKEPDTTDNSVVKKNTVTETRSALDKSSTYFFTLPTGYKLATEPFYGDYLPVKSSDLSYLANAIKKTGTNNKEYYLEGINLPSGFSGKAEGLARVIDIKEFNFAAKQGDMVPQGQDVAELGTPITTTGLANGYFSTITQALNAMSNCSTSFRNAWIPLSETSTVLLSVYECNQDQITKGVVEGSGSRPVRQDALTDLDQLLKSIIDSIKKGA